MNNARSIATNEALGPTQIYPLPAAPTARRACHRSSHEGAPQWPSSARAPLTNRFDDVEDEGEGVDQAAALAVESAVESAAVEPLAEPQPAAATAMRFCSNAGQCDQSSAHNRASPWSTEAAQPFIPAWCRG